MYVCLSVSHQDRLEYMKCFHSCMCMRHSFGSLLGVIEKDDAYVSWLGAKCSPTRYIHRADALRNAQRNTDKWKHSFIHIRIVRYVKVIFVEIVKLMKDEE